MIRDLSNRAPDEVRDKLTSAEADYIMVNTRWNRTDLSTEPYLKLWKSW
jgi:hypothetical protein